MQENSVITWGMAAHGSYEVGFEDGVILLSGELVDRDGEVVLSFASDGLGIHAGVRIEVAPVVYEPIRDWSVGGSLRRE